MQSVDLYSNLTTFTTLEELILRDTKSKLIDIPTEHLRLQKDQLDYLLIFFLPTFTNFLVSMVTASLYF